MKAIKTSLSTLLTSICSALLTLLGFSCSSLNGDEPCMYGMPTGTFEVKGAVTDEEGNAVKDAEIRVTRDDLDSGSYSNGTTKTNSKGKYEVEAFNMFGKAKIVCIPIQTDLQPDSVIVDMKFDGKGNSTWDIGVAKEIVNFKLKSTVSEEK